MDEPVRARIVAGEENDTGHAYQTAIGVHSVWPGWLAASRETWRASAVELAPC